MLKRLITCLITVLLVFSGGVALAADTMSEDLARITQSVKTTLAIGDAYTDFYGEQVERGYGVSWHLNWSNAEGNLNVEVDNDGLITSYYRYEYSSRYYSSDFAPIFPQEQGEQAKKIAEDFARRLLGKNEAMVFQDYETDMTRLRDQSSYYFGGYITVNGIPTPLNVSVSVNSADMQVSSFWRDTLNPSYVGGIPSGTAKIGVAAAEAKLNPLAKFTLAYYRSEADPATARLQYRPLQDNTFYVDANSGQLLDMNKLYAEAEDKTIDRGIASGGAGGMNDSRMSMSTADEAASAPQAVKLSPTEQAGIEKLDGLLTREQLDAKVRAISEFGVSDKYHLSSFTYRQEYNGSQSYYAAHLEYYAESDAKNLGISSTEFKRLRDEGQKLYTNKYISLDAKSGELMSLSTYRPYVNELLVTAKKQSYQKEAEAFLQRYCGEKFAQTSLWQPELGSAGIINGSDYLRYVRQVNGYNFEENNISVAANPFTGEIEHFSFYGWQDNVTFAPADNLIGEEQARQLYMDSLECRLVYRGLPEAIDPASQQMKPLLEYGYRMVYRLALVYSLEAEYPRNVYAIDALDGTALTYERQTKGALSYDDLDSHDNQTQIEKLGSYGVGFAGGSFKPASQLTELDMLVFLLSANGWPPLTDGLAKEKTDEVYRQAYSLGILPRGQQQPDKQISRGEFVKTLISMSGYGKTAAIPGIYSCNFADAAQIPTDLYGYVAIAQGLGLVAGGADKQFKAAEIINRAEAAVIFYNFLDRKY